MKAYYEPDRAGVLDPRGRKHRLISSALTIVLFPPIGFALAYLTFIAWRVAGLEGGPGQGGLAFLLPVALLAFILALRSANRLAARLLHQPHWWPYQSREDARRARRRNDLTALLLGLVLVVAYAVWQRMGAAAEIMIGLYLIAIAGMAVVDTFVGRLRH